LQLPTILQIGPLSVVRTIHFTAGPSHLFNETASGTAFMCAFRVMLTFTPSCRVQPDLLVSRENKAETEFLEPM